VPRRQILMTEYAKSRPDTGRRRTSSSALFPKVPPTSVKVATGGQIGDAASL
jgi:hypothetical protein